MFNDAIALDEEFSKVGEKKEHMPIVFFFRATGRPWASEIVANQSLLTLFSH
jgi:hypothetical protein